MPRRRADDAIGAPQGAGRVTPTWTAGTASRAVAWRRAGGYAAQGLLALVAALTCVVAALPLVGARFMVVTSGSMAPYAQVGDALLVVETPPDEVAAGDVLTFRPHGSPHLVTHRVVSTHEVGGERHFRTLGDANGSPDPDLAPAGGVVGTTRAVVPGLGHVVLLLQGRMGQLALVALPAALLLISEIRSLLAAWSRPQPSRRTRVRVGAGALLLVALGPVLWKLAEGATSTTATFTDVDTATTNTLSTASSF